MGKKKEMRNCFISQSIFCCRLKKNMRFHRTLQRMMTSNCPLGIKLAIYTTERKKCIKNIMYRNCNFSMLCKYYGHFKFKDKQNQQIASFKFAKNQ